MQELQGAKLQKRRKTCKIAIIVLLLVLLIGTIGFFYVGNYFFEYSLMRSEALEEDDREPQNIESEQERKNRELGQAALAAWLPTVETEEIRLTAEDGTGLWAKAYFPTEESHKWILAAHGYRSSHHVLQDLVRHFVEQGYQALTPDQRAHRNSEGQYIGMGWTERLDMLLWVEEILRRDPEAEIVLYGVSMGAATVMMTAGEPLPPNVKAVVEDCGYTSAYEMFVEQLDFRFGLPSFPVLSAAQVVAKIRADYDLKDADAMKQLEKATVPILFIHGSEDGYVPVDMVYTLYEIPKVEKEILVIEGAGHCNSLYVEPELYFETIFGFLEDKVQG